MNAQEIAAGVGAIAATVAAGMAVRKRFSADSNDIAKDKGETSLISRLMAERDAAQQEAATVRQQRTQDAEEIARLRAENRFLQVQLEQALAEMRKRMRGLPQDLRRIVDTGFVDLDDDDPTKTPPPPKTPPRQK